MEITKRQIWIVSATLASLVLTPFISSKVIAASGLDDDVKLLLHGGVGDNIVTTLRDSSFSDHTVTLNGDAKRAVDKFSQSGFFEGSGDYLSIADTASLELGNSSFTIDFWMYLPNVSGDKYIFAKRTSTATYSPFLLYVSGSTMYLYASASGSSWDVASNRSVATGLTANTWHHVAFVRSGNTIYTFVNGVQTDSFSTSATLFNNSEAWTLGGSATVTYFFTGNLDEFRMSVGTARWTSNFTPPTSPYTSDVNTSLLLHMDGTSGSTTFTDSSGSPKTVTANGNAVISSFSKFGSDGLCFDGSGDDVRTSTSADFNMQSAGDWTIDFWVNPRETDAQAGMLHINQGGNQGIFLQRYTSALRVDNGVSASITGVGSIPRNQWSHIAVARSGSTIYAFINGSLLQTASAQDYGNANSRVQIGSYSTGSIYFTGCFDEIRVSKGIARWTSNFTPPTEAYGLAGITLTGNVKFLRNVAVIGSLSKGAGTFVIDHPQKPRTHLLYHSFVESPEAKNIYDGIVELDSNGEATIPLPDYFEALNKDFRYQYFPIGEAMPNLHVKEKVKNNQFVIAGGKPGGRVSWQVTGVRHDPYIEANPIQVEVEKGPGELVDKGECLHEVACI